jgi:hypothetical protein
MAAVAAIAGVGMMVCCSSSVAALMMGGDDDDKKAAGGGGGGDDSDSDDDSEPILPSGQYVKLVHTVAQDNSAAGNADDKNKILNLAELEVFAEDPAAGPGSWISLTDDIRGIEAANFHGAGPLGNLVDGNFTNFAHTLGRTADDFDAITVDLGSVKEIGKIKITNRVDCCQKRAIGVKAVILGADGTTVIKETPAITTNAATYTFTFPGTAWA